jgi:cysteine desulfurase
MAVEICYLDNNASTRTDPRVLAAMLPFYSECYGNPSSLHHFGAQVLARIEEARAAVARLVGARESEIVFTSGGTESNNAALRGVLSARPGRRRMVLSAVEHHALLEPAEELERLGYEIIRIGVDSAGRLDLAALREAVTPDTALVSIMLANNETGVVFPLREVAEIAQRAQVPVHTDAVNAAGKLPIDVEALGVSLLSLSGHKLHGPKGVGALYVRRGAAWRPWQLGGPQERGRRGGTLNAPGIIGLGVACDLAREEYLAEMSRVRALRDDFEARIAALFPDAVVAGAAAERTPNTSCLLFPGVEAEALILLLSEAGVCASSGAACSSGSLEPSHVLKAMNIAPEIAQGQVRFSFSRFSQPADIDRVLSVLPDVLARVAAVNVA